MGVVQEFITENITTEVIATYIGVVSIGSIVGARQVWKNFYKQPTDQPKQTSSTNHDLPEEH